MELPPIEFQPGQPYTEVLYKALKEAIIGSKIKPREHLIIGELVSYYGISRTPVREALIKLEKDGWLEKDGRRGVKVLLPSKENLLQIVHTQAALEAYAASELAKKELPADFFDELRQVLDESEKAIEENNLQKAEQCNSRFNKHLYTHLDNEFLYDLVLDLEEKVTRVRLMQFHHGMAPTNHSIKQHREIMQAIEEHKPQEAYQLMYHHTVWFEDELMQFLQHY